ncbi:UPF0235 protein [Alsobacter metallidurans]|uniref:UPF0235 protein GCM10007036_44900 n=1 Tax=Alsobacter metallidurans TaxID=340221 RepID=A0A917MJQ7_9HYPH|nr:DUF167 family protein [Alsobacter metallidurans]GGH32752.1 UPF0235 protein [Alsobacter metallidurans]
MAAETSTTPWTVDSAGLIVYVRLTPKGGKDCIEGIEALANGKPVLKARVRAVPEAGKANAALARLLADACGVAHGSVALTAGGAARVKTLRIDGEPEALASRLAQACVVRRARAKAAPTIRKAADS